MLHSWPTCFLILLGIFQGRPRGCLPVPPRARTQRGVSAWLEVGEFVQTPRLRRGPRRTRAGSTSASTTACATTSGGCLLPSEVGKAGLGIPDSKLAARARRAAADGAPAPLRERICDGYGLQLETACLPGDHINESAPAPSVTSWPATCRACRRRRGGSLLTCCRRLCSTARVRAWCQTSPPPRARAWQPAPAAGVPHLRRGGTS